MPSDGSIGGAVVSNPPTRLDRWERRAEWPLAVVAAIFLVALSVNVLAPLKPAEKGALEIVLTGIWGFFVVDYLVRLGLATNRVNWFFRHIVDFAMVALPILRPLRLLRLIVLFGALQKVVGGAIRGRVVSYSIFSALLLIYGSSLAIFETERYVKDSKITTFGDALWWSISTVTTVGYGDMTPVTLKGRLIAVVLMIGGISLVGVVTATTASWIIQRVTEEDAAKQAVTSAEIDGLRLDLQNRVESLTEELRRLASAVDSLRPVDSGGAAGTRSGAGAEPSEELDTLSAELERIGAAAASLERV